MATPFETEFVVMLQRKTFIGSRYTIPVEQPRPISQGLGNEIPHE